MHALAYCYHWGRDEIRSIPRTEREMWYNIIQEQLKAERNSINKSGNSSKNSYKESGDYY